MKQNTIEDEIIDSLGKEISAEMDFEIMKELLIESGWHTVQLPLLLSREHSVDVKDWITEHCKEGHLSRGRTFLFKSTKEAEWFILRWL